MVAPDVAQEPPTGVHATKALPVSVRLVPVELSFATAPLPVQRQVAPRPEGLAVVADDAANPSSRKMAEEPSAFIATVCAFASAFSAESARPRMKNALKRFFTVFLLEDVVLVGGKVGQAHREQWTKKPGRIPCELKPKREETCQVVFQGRVMKSEDVLLSERFFPRFYLD